MTIEKFISIFVLSIIVIGCGEDVSQNSAPNESNIVESQKINPGDIENIDFIDYGLSSDARIATDNWIPYQQISTNIEFIKEGDLSFINGEIEDIRNTFEELKNSIPLSLNTNPIKARILALETMVYKANSNSEVQNLPKSDKLQDIKNILVAMSHFNDQMNKKFEIETNNILRK